MSIRTWTRTNPLCGTSQCEALAYLSNLHLTTIPEVVYVWLSPYYRQGNRKHGDVKSLADKGSDTEWRNGDLNPGKLILEPGSCLVWGGTCPGMAERESPFSLLSLTIPADQHSDPRLPPHPPSPLPSLWRLCLLSRWLCQFLG